MLAMHSAVAVADPRLLGGAARARHRAEPGVQRRGLAAWTSTRRTAAWLTRSTATSTGRTEPVAISLGPPIVFLKPPSALIVAPARRYHGRPAMSSSFPLDGMRVRFAGDSNVGMKRAHNEDSFYLPESERLAIVADGMGGHASGEVASRMAVDTIVGFFKATPGRPERTWPYKMDHGQALRREPADHRDQAREPPDLRAGAAGSALPRHGHHRRVDAVPRSTRYRRARRRQPRCYRFRDGKHRSSSPRTTRCSTTTSR